MSNLKTALLISACTMLCLASAGVRASDADLDLLLDGVKEIGRPGVPGSICVFGKDAFAVVQDAQKDGVESAVVAAARFGKGRVVVFGHGGYFCEAILKVADTGRLMVNAARWAAGPSRNKSKPLRVGVYHNNNIAPFLKRQGFHVSGTDLADLASLDVLFADVTRAPKKDQAKISAFVKGGKGLVSFGIGWGWLQLNKGKDLRTDYPVNQLFAPMGLVFTNATTKKTSEKGYEVSRRPSPFIHAQKALDAYNALSARRRKLSDEELAQVGATLMVAFNSIPLGDKLLMPRLKKLLGRIPKAAYPTREHPFRQADILKRIVLINELHKLKKLPPEEVKPHPAAADFPGAVPEDARPVTRTVEVNTAVPRWHSTGLYAAPGALITIEVPRAAVGKNLKVRIGAHKDKIWNRPVWQRMPDISRAFNINSVNTPAANAFGGLVYIVVPKKCNLGTIKVTIAGAVEAPYFVRGKTDLNAWRNTIRKRPAPWAELATDKIIITTQSSYVRELDDPEALMEVWDRVLDACADLATIPHERESPERIVLDRQISAGSLHAGYPIMGHLRWSADALVSRDALLKGNWGFFHELGHNHQSPAWTFEGTGEVTVNLFSLYVQEKVCGIKPSQDRRVGTKPRKKLIRQFLETGQKKPFVFLVMYVQMQEGFGWDAFKKVFAEYRALPRNELPKTDDEKRDQWLVRFSRTVGRNLGPFFEWWRVPTSKKARDSIADLPVWMPSELPKSSGLPTRNDRSRAS